MSNIIEYDRLCGFLKEASVFEIYRLSVAIQNELEDPARLLKLNLKIKEGDTVEYFNAKTNNFIKAIVTRKGLKNVGVQHIHDGQRWEIPLYWLNIDSRELVFENKAKGLDKNSIQVGDFVGFYNQKLVEEMTGCVERLNPKTVTVMTAKGRWRVSYRLLCSVIDGQKTEELKRLG